jgi:imidazolonepropionase-like amidohydrolase
MKKTLIVLLKLLAAVSGLAALWFTAGILTPLDVPQANPRPERLLIVNAAVVDVEQGLVRKGYDVLIENGEITAVGPGLESSGAVKVDAGGRYAIPGLFDMHMHSFRMAPSLTHPLFVAAGVTAVRDMGGCIGIDEAWVACAEEKRAWDAAVKEGRMVGPRYDVVTSLAINGGSEIPNGMDKALGAATAAGARARVAHDKARGIDFLKTYTRLSPEGFQALAQAAREEGLYLAGHLPLSVSGLEAVAAGQRSIEHAFLFIWECYPDMDDIRFSDDPRSVYTHELREAMIARHDPDRCSRLHESMAAAGTAFVPTHTTRKLDAFSLDESFRNDSRLRYIPGPLRMLWLNDADGMAARAGEEGLDSYRDFYEFGIAQTGIAHRAGVTVLAGSDAPDSFAFPGSGLHDELAHLVQAGMSPLDALRAATLEPARFLGLESSAGELQAGVIRPGARADIVLLNSNPLEDIGAVRDIEAVVLAGAVYDRTELNNMLSQVERSAGSWTMWPKFIWQILRSPIMMKQFAD